MDLPISHRQALTGSPSTTIFTMPKSEPTVAFKEGGKLLVVTRQQRLVPPGQSHPHSTTALKTLLTGQQKLILQ